MFSRIRRCLIRYSVRSHFKFHPSPVRYFSATNPPQPPIPPSTSNNAPFLRDFEDPLESSDDLDNEMFSSFPPSSVPLTPSSGAHPISHPPGLTHEFREFKARMEREETTITAASSDREVEVMRLSSHTLAFQKSKLRLTDLKSYSGLHARDLLMVDSTVRQQAPIILPRRKCIVVAIDICKALVFHDEVILFDLHRPNVQTFAEDFQRFLQGIGHQDMTAFEVSALEGLLHGIMDKYHRRLCLFVPVVHAVLHSLTDGSEHNSSTTTEEDLRRLLPLKNSLNSFEAVIDEIQQALKAILETDNMMSFCLSPYPDPRDERHPPHEEIEAMLQNCHRRITLIGQQCTYLNHSIQSTQDVVNMNLSAMRNRVLRINMQVSLASCSLAGGGTVAALFGMNLNSGLEENIYAFPIMAGVVLSLTATIFSVLVSFSRGTKQEAQRLRDIKAVQSLLYEIDDIESILLAYSDAEPATAAPSAAGSPASPASSASSASSTSPDSLAVAAGLEPLTRDRLTSLLQQATRREVSAREVELLFRVFDRNGDGVLDRNEILAILPARRIIPSARNMSPRWSGSRTPADWVD
eukprot:TRINITY_DN6026_c0_g1_i2.p1 TRINITY_DN6026_c0_g1~~TRINITY_DN6026_c0_g1_i2.p1  ORF type:complete len:580 (+),score=107.61 TRINITY_DN6026_c0_g1_i2:57-1796(+)